MNRRRLAWAILIPGLIVLIVGFLFPVAHMLVLSVTPPGPDQPFWANFARFGDSYYLSVAWRSLKLSAIITVATALVGFPLAYAIASARPWLRTLLLILTVLPLMTSVVVRTFGWIVVMGRGGPAADLLTALGVGTWEAVLLHTETGLVIAMVQVLLPFMTLTALGAIAAIHPHLGQAARTMGAGFYRTLWHVVLPLSLPGIVSGALLVFVLAISSFVTPALIGGVRLPVLAGSIYQQATTTLDWGFAAAQSAILLGAVLFMMLPAAALTGRRRG
ncbi:MAG: ABC transporter permease [Inquilinaceae bacterium]